MLFLMDLTHSPLLQHAHRVRSPVGGGEDLRDHLAVT